MKEQNLETCMAESALIEFVHRSYKLTISSPGEVKLAAHRLLRDSGTVPKETGSRSDAAESDDAGRRGGAAP